MGESVAWWKRAAGPQDITSRKVKINNIVFAHNIVYLVVYQGWFYLYH